MRNTYILQTSIRLLAKNHLVMDPFGEYQRLVLACRFEGCRNNKKILKELSRKNIFSGRKTQGKNQYCNNLALSVMKSKNFFFIKSLARNKFLNGSRALYILQHQHPVIDNFFFPSGSRQVFFGHEQIFHWRLLVGIKIVLLPSPGSVQCPRYACHGSNRIVLTRVDFIYDYL